MQLFIILNDHLKRAENISYLVFIRELLIKGIQLIRIIYHFLCCNFKHIFTFLNGFFINFFLSIETHFNIVISIKIYSCVVKFKGSKNQ